MNQNVIYHGSNIVVQNPKILVNGHYKDFGYGFYCTNIERQAKRWALAKHGSSVVSTYTYCTDNELLLRSFQSMTEEWLQFVVDCRRGIEHNYDIVEGPMADDQVWDYVEDYVEGTISRAAFWELIKFKYPTHQICFCTERAFRALHYEGSYRL